MIKEDSFEPFCPSKQLFVSMYKIQPFSRNLSNVIRFYYLRRRKEIMLSLMSVFLPVCLQDELKVQGYSDYDIVTGIVKRFFTY